MTTAQKIRNITRRAELAADDIETTDDIAYGNGLADGYYRHAMAQVGCQAYADGYDEGRRMYAAEFDNRRAARAAELDWPTDCELSPYDCELDLSCDNG